MKVNGRNTEYMCVEETQANGTVRMQGEEVANVDDLKYLLESDGGEEKKRSGEYSMMEWLDKNARSDLRHAITS